MLIRRDILNRIASGEVDLAFRWWKRPTVKTGGRLRTAVGELSIVDVSAVHFESLTKNDAQRAGYRSLENLKTELAQQSDRTFYRIALQFSGADSRTALRDDVNLSAEQCAELIAGLDRIDKGTGLSGMSLRTLELIDRFPERRAQELADELGLAKEPFKIHVRKLKEKGLTESLSVGYRLSPRGQHILNHARKTDAR